MKRCTTCKELKTLTEYNKNKSKKDNLNTICRLCSQKRSRQYYKENKEKHIKEIGKRKKEYIEKNKKFILEHLRSNECVDCGESDPVVLEFDHVRGKKTREISIMMRNACSLGRIKEEIKKCEIRCANCHRRKTAKDQNWYKTGCKH